LALLVAQFGAEIHLFTHALADPSDWLGAARSCAGCVASSHHQDAIAPSAPAMPAYSRLFATLVAEVFTSADHQAPFRAFRSRAPPVLV
jgi:hypothetical protein